MRNKGFIITEILKIMALLSVTVFFVTLTVLFIRESNRKEEAKSIAYDYVNTMEKNISNSNIDDGIYTISQLLELDILKKEDDLKEGWVEIIEKKVTDYLLEVRDYLVAYDSNKNKSTVERNVEDVPEDNSNQSHYKDGTAIYFDPTKGVKCNKNSSISKTGVKSGCMKWYTFGDSEDKSTVRMILDHNTSIGGVAYNSNPYKYTHIDGAKLTEMDEVAKELTNNIKDWTASVKETARLITADEIASIAGNKSFDAKTSEGNEFFYFETGTKNDIYLKKGEGTYKWLYDYTEDCCRSGCDIEEDDNGGYWTSDLEDGFSAWTVRNTGSLNVTEVSRKYDVLKIGVRPVITVPKALIR